MEIKEEVRFAWGKKELKISFEGLGWFIKSKDLTNDYLGYCSEWQYIENMLGKVQYYRLG